MGLIEKLWPDISKKHKRAIFMSVEVAFLLAFLILGILSLLLIKSYIIFYHIGLISIFIGILAIIIAEVTHITKDSHLTPLEQMKSVSDTFAHSLNRAKKELRESKYEYPIPTIITELYNEAKENSIKIWADFNRVFFGFIYLVGLLTCLLYILEEKHGSVFIVTIPDTLRAHLYIVTATMLSLGEGSLDFVNSSEGQFFEIVVIISSFIYSMIFVSIIISNMSSGGEKYYTAIRQFVWDHACPPNKFFKSTVNNSKDNLPYKVNV